ncbi:60S acidic ribosomal protein P2-like [Hydractinia symbiolongicarpus]|uniref:60S acidic ribosomal protein P2-like n=1 Tax=Hydractinia symbiolongicarpus TaxID=13093 RepID=UPI00254C21CE|nr:60S acidic ribosomal protein P2-like [Hydractinia symbiolongicarpus]XP_057294823.1 60S acidic ribosomal protein P2-like [Hydractinia symbiolongicarpus]
MRYVAAYMLAVLGGNETPCEADIKNILESVGVGYDAERAATLVAQLKGKSLSELIEEGSKKMASMPAGGGGGGAPAAGGAAAGGGAAQEEKKEEKKQESEEESDDDMGFGLFD